MAYVRISDLTAASALTSADLFEVTQGGASVKATGAQITTLAQTGVVTTFSAGTTGLTPAAATTGAVTLAGTLAVANGGTGITSLGAGVATWLGTPSSANLAAAVTGETGTGALVFASSPTLVTPDLGTPSAAVLTNATGLPLTTGVTGTLPIANGGTGQTTANTAFNALAPSQTSQSSKFLTTDGTNTSWATPVAAAASVTIGTTTVISGTSGYILYNNSGSLGNLATTGTGSVVLSNQPAFNAGVITGSVVAGTFTSTATGSSSLTVANASTNNTAVARLLTDLSGVVNGFAGWGVQYNSGSPFAYMAVGAGVTGGLQLQTNTRITGTAQLDSALTYGGVTLSNSVTGTGSMVLSASPTFTGTPAAPTASPGTNTTQVATTAYADALVSVGRVRAWVNFDGATGTVNASGNVTSVTRITTGTYVVNLTSAIPANAAWSYGSYAAASTNFTMLGQITAQTTTTSPRVAVATIAGALVDPDTAWLTAIA